MFFSKLRVPLDRHHSSVLLRFCTSAPSRAQFRKRLHYSPVRVSEPIQIFPVGFAVHCYPPHAKAIFIYCFVQKYHKSGRHLHHKQRGWFIKSVFLFFSFFEMGLMSLTCSHPGASNPLPLLLLGLQVLMTVWYIYVPGLRL